MRFKRLGNSYSIQWVAVFISLLALLAVTLALAEVHFFPHKPATPNKIHVVPEEIQLFNPTIFEWPPLIKPVKEKPVRVNATLVISVSDKEKSNRKTIRLADRLVYLREAKTKKRVDKGQTQLDGKLNLLAPQAGVYQLCWKVENIDSDCSRRFNVGDKTVYLGNIFIRPDNRAYAYGNTLMHEDRPCWLNDPYFDVDLFTEVSILNTHGKIAASPVKANVSGEYVVGLPRGERYQLRSRCEKTVYQTTHFIGANGVRHIDLPLDNYVPTKIELAAFIDKKGITRAPAGEVIVTRLLAHDRDAQALDITWKVLDGSGAVTGSQAKEEEWMLPTTPGMHQIYVMARDAHGGYLIESLPMQVGVPTVHFSGIVIDEVTRLPIINARVDVLGESTTTDNNGWFALKVEALAVEKEQRYPLNINHYQYATYSRVLDKASRGNTYSLIQAQVTQHDPRQPIDVVDARSSGPCGRGNPERGFDDKRLVGYRDERKALNPKLLQGHKLRLVRPDQKCERQGARLQLPAKALVYADQTPAVGPISLSMATLNPSRRSLPGDYRAIDANKDAVELVSFGALFAEFRDVNGKKVNLKKGVEAMLSIPIPNEHIPLAENTIPMWSYDEKTGFWIEEGKGELNNTSDGLRYVGTTRHFSTINMDVAGNDPANATCVRLERGNSLNAWTNLTLRAYVSVGGSAVQVKETALDNAQYHAIYRIPYSDPPAGNTLRLELRGELPSGDAVVLLEDIIATDLRPKMTGNNLWPSYPYTECGVPIVLEADPVDLPYYGDINATGKPAFLTGPYGRYLPSNAQQTSSDYYLAIDPTGTKTTLGAWWVTNGFASDGSGGTRASYLNHNDLGFGRDMHCLGDSTDYACYVTNYGLPDQNPANADDAVSKNPATQGATVTMEYHQAASDTAVSFYAYNGGTAAATRIQFADLDGLGPKPIPHLCMVCHGGGASDFNVDNLAHDAAFREFDLPSFKYSGNRSWDFSLAFNTLTATELASFATINAEVAAINTGNKIAALINAWYSGGGDQPAQLNNTQIPSGWTGHEDTYRDLYGTTCRTCHIARSGIVDTFNTFSFSGRTVCETPRVMPNAFITYKNFWSDLNRVNLFEIATGTAIGTCFQ